MDNFRLVPQAASTLSHGVDALMIFMLVIAVFFSILIAAFLLFFAAKYHHTRTADRSNPPAYNLPIELLWTGVPLLLVFGIFAWGAELFISMRTPPADAMELYVVGKQWMWKIQHPEGQREINEIHVPVGRPVKLLMTSEDVIHSFFVPDFRMKQDVLPGRYTSEWFEASAPGRHHLFCSQYCGTSHSSMIGWIVAMPPADYQRWLSGTAPEQEGGEALFHRLGCSTCHAPQGSSSAPSLAELYGKTVPLEGGGSVVADEDYLRESILRPNAKIVKGYRPIMPTFQGRVDEEQIDRLIAYIKSLKRSA